MSYSRTVHCSHCGGRGHNKSGCPDYKEQIERRRAVDPNDYTVRQYDAKRQRRADSAQNRRCSYCGEQGHNRAGCSKLKAAMESYRAKNVEYRRNWFDAIVKGGLGPGAMVELKTYWSELETYMIVGIDWPSVNMHDKGNNALQVVKLDRIRHLGDSRYWTEMRLSQEITGSSYGPEYKILVPSTEYRIRTAMPSTFMAGTLGLKAVFKEKNSSLLTMKDSYGTFDNAFDPDNYSTDLCD
jgi:hypothetical protein